MTGEKTTQPYLTHQKRTHTTYANKKVSKDKRRLSTLPEEIGNTTGHKSLLKIRQATLSNETRWISYMVSMEKDVLIHYFLSTADLTKLT